MTPDLNKTLRVVPLFETLEDLDAGGKVMQRLLNLPWWVCVHTCVCVCVRVCACAHALGAFKVDRMTLTLKGTACCVKALSCSRLNNWTALSNQHMNN